jgi:hypothetical protein
MNADVHEKPGREWIARVVWAALVVGGLASIVTVRAIYDGEHALLACDEALRAKDYPTATARAREAAAWYAPGAPHVNAAYGRLVHIARTTEAEGNRESALLAWRAVRTAIIDSRWLLDTHEPELAAANRAILRLSAPEATPAMTDEQRTQDRLLEILLARRERARAPYVLLILGAQITMLASGGVFVGLARVKIAPRWPLVGVGVGVALYTLAVWLA